MIAIELRTIARALGGNARRSSPNWPCRNQTWRIGHVQRAVRRALIAAGGKGS